MQAADYEKALLVEASWKLALSNDVNELLAIACVIRNWVVSRFGVQRLPMDGKIYFGSYSEAIRTFLRIYPTRDLPAVNESALVDPEEGLLAKVDGVYDCTLVDMTSSRAFPGGARYFSRVSQVQLSSWFDIEVRSQQSIHPLIGTFGSQQFYG